MINWQEIVDVLLQEVRFHCGITTYQDAPNLTLDEKFARATTERPLPNRETIAYVFEEAFWASLLTEEGRPCRPRLLYSPREKNVDNSVHQFEETVLLNRDNLRRLTPVQGQLGYLTWDSASQKPEITGVQGRQGGDPPEFITSAPSSGALDISWSFARLVVLRAGRIDRLSRASLHNVGRALDFVREMLGSFDIAYLPHTIRAIANGGHGGAVWILREGHTLDGVQIGYPIRRSDPPSREKYEQRFKWLESVGHLAAVDGAVLIDSHLRVLGFGAFIDVPNSPKEVTCVLSAGGVEKRSSKELGGGRHRSAVEFCSRFAPAAAIVVSEDGRISIIGAITKDDPIWISLSKLGIYSGDII